jgi:hypothetical protein
MAQSGISMAHCGGGGSLFTYRSTCGGCPCTLMKKKQTGKEKGKRAKTANQWGRANPCSSGPSFSQQGKKIKSSKKANQWDETQSEKQGLLLLDSSFWVQGQQPLALPSPCYQSILLPSPWAPCSCSPNCCERSGQKPKASFLPPCSSLAPLSSCPLRSVLLRRGAKEEYKSVPCSCRCASRPPRPWEREK